MQCKDTFSVLFLYLRSANAFESANAILLNCARCALSLKFANLAMGTEKKGRTFLISEVRYFGNDSLRFLDQERQTDGGAVEIPSVYYLPIGWHDADCVPNQCSSKCE
jgi:hypothetical protein